jgi:hypothetical protein
MLSILFWNLGRKSLETSVANIALHQQVDLIALAESPIQPAELLVTLNRDNPTAFFFAPNVACKKLQLFMSFNPEPVPILEDERLVVRKLQKPGTRHDILVAILHFVSKANWDDADANRQRVPFS